MPSVNIDAVLEAANSKVPIGERRWTRKRLAEELEVSRQTLTNLNSGRVPLIINQLIRMSEISGLTVDEFIMQSTEEAEDFIHGRK